MLLIARVMRVMSTAYFQIEIVIKMLNEVVICS